MVIAGAGGHARELLGVLAERNTTGDIFLFDNVTDRTERIYNSFPVLKTDQELKAIFSNNPDFCLGVGSPAARKILYDKLTGLGGKCVSVISPYARIGKYNVELADGLNVMTAAVITQDVSIGLGTLIHIHVTVHHDCRIGTFCELSPSCNILGKVTIGDMTSVGTGSVVLPGVNIGNNVVIGAGAVVTRNVEPFSKVVGVPARTL